MRTRAVVVRAAGEPARVEEITLREPGPGEVLVRVAAASLCHSDLSVANETLAHNKPVVLGHETSGLIAGTGPGVDGFAEGDPVLLLWNPPCRDCWYCAQGEPYLCENIARHWSGSHGFDDDGGKVHPCLGVGGFAEYTVVPASACRRLPADIPLDLAALLGCAVTTGVGAVLSTANVHSGQSVVVVGLGGVGLAAVQGARIAGAEPIIAVDRVPEKLEMAASMGATETLLAGPDVRKQVKALTGGRGADHVFDCVGLAATIKEGWKTARRGGTLTVVGIGGRTEVVEFSSLELYHFARSILTCVNGSLDPDRELPSYIEHVRAGRLDLPALVSGEIGLDGVPAALGALAEGRVARVLVKPGT
ncbi:zinc-binding dehydrogenase [Amycolatopsis sp. 195334CR]|uniref:zinc-binding dehydrogenase n=1 Tax=Amycolatopsis sp. 195334CR TaxID=2814588 RepID=UPI001A8D713E|nr:zinc-binding dehydrogenase [Amycolatopsis sp. 195334CR]MBN6034808.1 zinc-binding dehydrogenase [Amycolatopsis sp. 195334CR]